MSCQYCEFRTGTSPSTELVILTTHFLKKWNYWCVDFTDWTFMYMQKIKGVIQLRRSKESRPWILHNLKFIIWKSRTMVSMGQIITFLFFLGINTVISKPIYGNLYEEQILHEQIEQHEHSATHEVPANRSYQIEKKILVYRSQGCLNCVIW